MHIPSFPFFLALEKKCETLFPVEREAGMTTLILSFGGANLKYIR